jgi:hypothetical protein
MNTLELESLCARREAVVNAHIEAEAVQHDVAATLATFVSPCCDVPALGGVLAEVQEWMRPYVGCWEPTRTSGYVRARSIMQTLR